jgi:hypothetical protein
MLVVHGPMYHTVYYICTYHVCRLHTELVEALSQFGVNDNKKKFLQHYLFLIPMSRITAKLWEKSKRLQFPLARIDNGLFHLILLAGRLLAGRGVRLLGQQHGLKSISWVSCGKLLRKNWRVSINHPLYVYPGVNPPTSEFTTRYNASVVVGYSIFKWEIIFILKMCYLLRCKIYNAGVVTHGRRICPRIRCNDQ